MLDRLRAHRAVFGVIAVVALAGVSVVSLVIAEGRLDNLDAERRAGGATSPVATAVVTIPSTLPSTSTTTTAPVAISGPASGLAADLFALINADRVANGLPALTWDDRLGATAQRVSDSMAKSTVLAPQDLTAILALGYARANENVLTGPSTVTATSAEYGWMGSAPHRASILSTTVRSIGIGATSSVDGRIWIAADFGG